VRYETTPAFDRDYRRLKGEHRKAFRAVVLERFAPACDAWAAATDDGKIFVWPRSLRVGALVGTRGILEMTWSFASPDGRATSEFVRTDTWTCRWRRVGDHDVFGEP
jgi:hypothetical protein